MRSSVSSGGLVRRLLANRRKVPNSLALRQLPAATLSVRLQNPSAVWNGSTRHAPQKLAERAFCQKQH